VPTGRIRFIQHAADNLVIELALMGGSDVLVTGDRKHSLPLKSLQGMIIEPPSRFLERLDENRWKRQFKSGPSNAVTKGPWASPKVS
jgi:hypothetical protein